MQTALRPEPKPVPPVRADAAAGARPRPRAAWPWALLAVLLAATALTVHVARRQGGDVSGTYYVVEASYRALPLHEAYPPGRLLFQSGPYDGAFFLALANDPFLESYEGDTRFHRARRILWPWAACLLGAGQPEAILYTLPLLTLLAIGAGTLALARLLAENGRHPAWALLNALSLGAAVCLLRSVADAFAVNLVIVGAWAWQKERPKLAVAFFALAGLAKEPTLLVPIALFAALFARGEWRRGVKLAIPPAVVLAWWGIVFATSSNVHFGRSVGIPFAGLVRSIAQPLPALPEGEWLALASMVLAVALVPLARRAEWDRWRAVAFAFALLAALGYRGLWEEYWAYGRAFMAVPAFLLFLYAVHGRKSDLLGPIGSALSGAYVFWTWM